MRQEVGSNLRNSAQSFRRKYSLLFEGLPKMAQKPKLLTVPTLSKIHITHPEVGKALQEIIRYINANLTPRQGNRQ